MEATLTDSAQHTTGADTGQGRIRAEKDEDDRVDTWAILVIFCALILGAVHFISGGALL